MVSGSQLPGYHVLDVQEGDTREDIVGFYSTGPKLKENDLKISAIFKKFCTHEPVFIIIDVRPMWRVAYHSI